jgi:hypothetical protein
MLTLAMLAFGALTGVAASNPSGALSALRHGPLTLLIPARAPAATAMAAASPPPVEASSTPEPAESTPPAETAPVSGASSSPASTTTSHGSGHGKSGTGSRG